ncbi:hypothetical protein V1281_006094 [Nitrobacteraceae bacterium AZCC 2161]
MFMGYFLIESALPPSLSATALSSNGFIEVFDQAWRSPAWHRNLRRHSGCCRAWLVASRRPLPAGAHRTAVFNRILTEVANRALEIHGV